MGRCRKTKQAKQENKQGHEVIILYCDESFSIEDNWIFSPSTIYEFYLRPDNFNFDVTLVVNGNGLNLNLPVNRFASFIFGSMIVGECVIMFENEVIIDFIILELPSIGGYSGGPLFDLGYIKSAVMTMTKEKTILYGIVHGTISDTTGGKLAAITPLKYLNGWM